MKVQAYLERVSGGADEASFVREFPHYVLVELDAQPGEGGDIAAVTERLSTARVHRQTQASRDALVLPLSSRAARSALPTEGEALVVGRALHCDLQIDHPSVSKEQARFRFGEGRLVLEDLGSTNGTQLNGRRLDAHTEAQARQDDTIVFGKATGFQLMSPEGFYNYLGLLHRFGL